MKQTFWHQKRVLVTGATGLVGSWLTRRLVDAGAQPIVLIRDWDPQSELIRSGTIHSVSVVNGRLEDYATIERALNEHEVDTVFHMGAQTIVGTANRSPLQTFEANIRGTYNLLEACRVHRDLVARVLIASSDKAYGSSEVLPYTEEMPPMGRHPYDVSKSCTDLLSQTYHHTYRLPVVVARCGNIYGGGDLNWSRIIPGTIRSLYLGQAPVIRSDGTYTRDYVYVQDAVDAYMTMAENLDRKEVQGEAFNFGPTKPLSVLDIVNTIRDVMDCKEIHPIIADQVHGEIRDQYLSSAKAAKMLGWQPSYDLRRGLDETVAWYREFFEAGGLHRTPVVQYAGQ